jgi:hypothetical protein
VELKNENDKITDYWPATTPPDPNLIHIIVELPSCKCCVHLVSGILLTVSQLSPTSSAPVLGKRSRAADDPKLTDLPWLKEVHKKIWNQEDLRPELFRKVEVTQAVYTAMQERLKELHSDRDEPNYNGSKPDVLRVKLDFLRSLNRVEALPSKHPDDDDNRVDDDDYSEARNEDDVVLQSLFPYILEFLDLSTLGFKVTRRLPLPLLLRQEYKHISELIEKEPEGSGGSVIVSGQPGTGEFLVSLSPSHRV